jgi:hypothetical protein
VVADFHHLDNLDSLKVVVEVVVAREAYLLTPYR